LSPYLEIIVSSQTNWLSQLRIATIHPCQSLLLRCLTIGLLVSSAGCTGGQPLQDTFAPDPQLKPSGDSSQSSTQATNIPPDFPLYPQAKLQSTNQTPQGTVTTWTSSDSIESIYKFYQQELVAKQWEIVTAPTDGNPQLAAKQAQLSVTIAPQASTEKQQAGTTTYTISLLGATAVTSPTSAATTPPVIIPSPPVDPVIVPPLPADPVIVPLPPADPVLPANRLPRNRQIAKPPTATAEYLTDLTKIGVLTSADAKANRIVTRREYARWLVAAHNKITGAKPTQQLKLATTDTKPAFQDVPATNPDFPSIQGLAEAGLIASALTGDATSVLFRPDAPLTREQLILWKVPLDTRQPLPAASLDAVKQTWGFQDAGKVDPKALRAVLADFQNGEQSNIRRVFGYTTLFQPKKTVNLGEAAIAIWYFGANSEGLSARDAIGN
jgi:S-layer homology domain